MGCKVDFRAILDKDLLLQELNCACSFFMRALICRHVSRARKQEQVKALLPVVYGPSLSYFIGSRHKYMFESSLKLSLRIQVFRFQIFLIDLHYMYLQKLLNFNSIYRNNIN